MEIIERGTLPGEVEYEARCMYCKTKVRFKRDEAKHTSDQRDGDFLTVACPVCGQPIHSSLRRS